MIERTFTLRGLHFGALEWGTPEGIPTVFLHGFLDHAGSWEGVARHLGGWRLGLDLRGHGRTAWVGPGQTYHFSEYIADLDALVDQLGGRVRLVGHSMGGTLASIYAGARPDRVERLAVVDGIGLADGGSGARTRMIEFLDGVTRMRVQRPMATIDEAVARLRHAWGVDAATALVLATRGTRAEQGGLVWAYDPRHRGRSAVPYRQDQHLLFLAAITCPVLSVHPERSLFAPEDVTRLESAIPHLRVAHISGSGHMVQLNAPRELAGHLAHFLEAQPRHCEDEPFPVA
jgi:pimeloyl-ACP methyl ester carboxylesterase